MSISSRKRARKAVATRKKDNHSYRMGDPPLACGKSCYASKSVAKSALRRAMGSGSMVEKEFMGHYWCDKCQAWHIGHDRPAGWRKWA